MNDRSVHLEHCRQGVPGQGDGTSRHGQDRSVADLATDPRLDISRDATAP